MSVSLKGAQPSWTLFLLVAEGVDHGDVGVHSDWAAIEDSGAITPKADGGESGLDEEGIAGDDLERFDRAFGRDEGVEFDAALMVNLYGERGITGLDACGELGHLLEFARADKHWRFGRVWWWGNWVLS